MINPLKTRIRYSYPITYFFVFIISIQSISSATEESRLANQEILDNTGLEEKIPLSIIQTKTGKLKRNRILQRIGSHSHNKRNNRKRGGNKKPPPLPSQSSCASGTFEFKRRCLNKCPNSHFVHLGNCVRCSEGCSNCTSYQNCTKCSKGHVLDTVSKYCRKNNKGDPFILLVFAFLIYVLYAYILVITLSVIILSKPKVRVRRITPEQLAEFHRMSSGSSLQSSELQNFPAFVELDIKNQGESSKIQSISEKGTIQGSEDTKRTNNLPKAYGIGVRPNSENENIPSALPISKKIIIKEATTNDIRPKRYSINTKRFKGLNNFDLENEEEKDRSPQRF